MAEINNVILSGRMSKDVEMRISGKRMIGNFNLALNESYLDKANNTKIERVNFFECVCFGKTAELISQYCKKGDSIVIAGKLNQDTYTDNSGNKKSKVKIFVETFKTFSKKEANKEPQIIYENFN